MNRAGVGVTMALEEANQEYLAKFGYIFIVCASGKSAVEMLSILKSRLSNTPEAEVRVAAEEQDKITRLRLDKLVPL
jgi:2-oxo-4-hydroxy-4-carboxy-5-ureidoimidazoline decarboxylase